MNPGNEIVKELEELASPLAAMPRTSPFAVPNGYFNELTAAMVAGSVYSNESVPDLPKEMPFTLPEGYFAGFSASLMDRIAEEPSFGIIEPAAFNVPSGYFEALPAQMLQAAKAADGISAQAPVKQQPKVISFLPQKALRWAAAALLLLAVGFGGYKMMNDQPQRLSVEKQLAQLDEKVISSYVQQHLDEFDTEMLSEGSPVLLQSPEKNIKKLDETDIRNYLEDGDI